MLIDGRTLKAEDRLTTDVCIVGAGAAGLTLAQALEGTATAVMLLDSGSFRSEPSTQSLAEGTAEHSPYPFSESRARCFGGSTTRWSGACVPLDASDFQAKAWLPYSGWPFERTELLPYYRQAQQVFGLPETLPPLPKDSPFQQSPVETKWVAFSQPLDLGRKYRQQILRSRNVTLVTHANVAQLVPDEHQCRVVRIEIKGPDGEAFAIAPQRVILATGGIENARLLLASNCPNGLGNQHDLVGRFFMEHYLKSVGILPIGQQRAACLFTDLRPLGQTFGLGTFGLTDDRRDREQLLNLHVRGYRYSLLEDTAAVIAAKQMLRDPAKAPSLWRNLTPDSWQILPRYAGWHLWNKVNKQAQFSHLRLQAWMEQEPDPNNRVTLSSVRDRAGQPQAHLTLRFSQKMWDGAVRSLQQLDQALRQRGLGPLEYDAARIQHLASYDKIGLHHMGTTRMHQSPRQGVVDADCRVHGMANLYVAGSSVFPTGGAANPTLTIAALALRLAEHIGTKAPSRHLS
ncbi:MAG: GMC family oxidoreductase [Leptolyngbya sp. SIO4C1]|nr:GMC family oxidoreductase [Leptolyngbya sp. SIO4C1]